jgi:hypothetical protein
MGETATSTRVRLDDCAGVEAVHATFPLAAPHTFAPPLLLLADEDELALLDEEEAPPAPVPVDDVELVAPAVPPVSDEVPPLPA